MDEQIIEIGMKIWNEPVYRGALSYESIQVKSFRSSFKEVPVKKILEL